MIDLETRQEIDDNSCIICRKQRSVDDNDFDEDGVCFSCRRNGWSGLE